MQLRELFVTRDVSALMEETHSKGVYSWAASPLRFCDTRVPVIVVPRS